MFLLPKFIKNCNRVQLYGAAGQIE